MGICSSRTNSSSVVPHPANLGGENVPIAVDNNSANSADGTDGVQVVPLSVDDAIDRESSQQNQALQLLQQQSDEDIVSNGSVNYGRASEISESALLPNQIPSDTSDDESNHLNVQKEKIQQVLQVLLPNSSLTRTQQGDNKAASVELSITSIASPPTTPTSPVTPAVYTEITTAATTTATTAIVTDAASTATKAADIADIPRPLTQLLPPITPAKQPKPLVLPIFHNQYGSTEGSQNKKFAEVVSDEGVTGGFMILLPPVSTSISSSSPASSSTTTTTTTTAATTSANITKVTNPYKVVPSSPLSPPLPPITPMKQQPQPAILHLLHHHRGSRSGSHPSSNTEFAAHYQLLLPPTTPTTTTTNQSTLTHNDLNDLAVLPAVEVDAAAVTASHLLRQTHQPDPQSVESLWNVSNDDDDGHCGQQVQHVSVVSDDKMLILSNLTTSLSTLSDTTKSSVKSDDDTVDYTGNTGDDEDDDDEDDDDDDCNSGYDSYDSSFEDDDDDDDDEANEADDNDEVNEDSSQQPAAKPEVRPPISPDVMSSAVAVVAGSENIISTAISTSPVSSSTSSATAATLETFPCSSLPPLTPKPPHQPPQQHRVHRAITAATTAMTLADGAEVSSGSHNVHSGQSLNHNDTSRYPLLPLVQDATALLPMLPRPRPDVEVQGGQKDLQKADSGDSKTTVQLLQILQMTNRTEATEAAAVVAGGSSSRSNTHDLHDDLHQWRNDYDRRGRDYRDSYNQIILDQKLDPTSPTCLRASPWAELVSNFGRNADHNDNYNNVLAGSSSSGGGISSKNDSGYSSSRISQQLQQLRRSKDDSVSGSANSANRVLHYLRNNEGACIGLRGKLRLLGNMPFPTAVTADAACAGMAGTMFAAASSPQTTTDCSRSATAYCPDNGSNNNNGNDLLKQPAVPAAGSTGSSSSSHDSIIEPASLHVAVLIRRYNQPASCSSSHSKRQDLLTKLLRAWSQVNHVFSIRSNALLPYCGPAIEFRREASIFDLQYLQRNKHADTTDTHEAAVAGKTEDFGDRIKRTVIMSPQQINQQQVIQQMNSSKRRDDESYLLLQAFPLPLGARTLFEYCYQSTQSSTPFTPLSSSTLPTASSSTISSAELQKKQAGEDDPIMFQAISFGRNSLCALKELHQCSWVHGQLSPHSCLILPGKTLREALFAPVEVPFAAATTHMAGNTVGLAASIADSAGYSPINNENDVVDAARYTFEDDEIDEKGHGGGVVRSSSVSAGLDAVAFDIRCWAVTLAFACWPPHTKKTYDAWSNCFFKKDFEGMMRVCTETLASRHGIDSFAAAAASRRTSSQQHFEAAAASEIFLKPWALAMQCVLQAAVLSLGHATTGSASSTTIITSTTSTNSSEYTNFTPMITTPTAHQLLRLALFNVEHSGLWTSFDGMFNFIVCWCNKWTEPGVKRPKNMELRIKDYRKYLWPTIPTNTKWTDEVKKHHSNIWDAATNFNSKNPRGYSGKTVWNLLKFIRNILTHANGSDTLANAAVSCLKDAGCGIKDDNTPSIRNRQRDVLRFILWKWPCIPLIIMIEQGWEDSVLLQSSSASPAGCDSLLRNMASPTVFEAIRSLLPFSTYAQPVPPPEPRPQGLEAAPRPPPPQPPATTKISSPGPPARPQELEKQEILKKQNGIYMKYYNAIIATIANLAKMNPRRSGRDGWVDIPELSNIEKVQKCWPVPDAAARNAKKLREWIIKNMPSTVEIRKTGSVYQARLKQ